MSFLQDLKVLLLLRAVANGLSALALCTDNNDFAVTIKHTIKKVVKKKDTACFERS